MTTLKQTNSFYINPILLQKMTEKDPSVYLIPDQPLVCSTKVSQSDVEQQEARVADTRKQLAEALAALSA